LGVRSTNNERIAAALLGQERSPQPVRQEAGFGLKFMFAKSYLYFIVLALHK